MKRQPSEWEKTFANHISDRGLIFKIYEELIQLRDFPGSPVVQNPPSNAGDVGLIPGQGTKIPQAAWGGQKTPNK